MDLNTIYEFNPYTSLYADVLEVYSRTLKAATMILSTTFPCFAVLISLAKNIYIVEYPTLYYLSIQYIWVGYSITFPMHLGVCG